MAFSVIKRAALACEYAHRLVVDQSAAKGIPLLGIRRRGDDAALALGEHLAGDHHDVVVAQPRRRRGDRRTPRRHPAGTREVLAPGRISTAAGGAVIGAHRGPSARIPASSSPLRTISAVAFGSVISSGIERTSTPSTVAASPSSTSQPSRMPTRRPRAVMRADGLRGGVDADHRKALIGHPAQCLSGHDGGVADDRCGRRRATPLGSRARRGWRRCSPPDWTARAARRPRRRSPR